jgi:hypothetical protein
MTYRRALSLIAALIGLALPLMITISAPVATAQSSGNLVTELIETPTNLPTRNDWLFPPDAVDDRAPVNGCGSQGDDGIDVPDQIGYASFTPACDWHDQCYGTKGLSQACCDLGMLDKTVSACGYLRRAPPWRLPTTRPSRSSEASPTTKASAPPASEPLDATDAFMATRT